MEFARRLFEAQSRKGKKVKKKQGGEQLLLEGKRGRGANSGCLLIDVPKKRVQSLAAIQLQGGRGRLRALGEENVLKESQKKNF